ncbi:hypothetical protein [Thalassotalea fusca]
MKQSKPSMMDLTQTQALLEKIEGGHRQQNIQNFTPNFDVIFKPTPCDLLSCVTPIYGAITDPRWQIKAD